MDPHGQPVENMTKEEFEAAERLMGTPDQVLIEPGHPGEVLRVPQEILNAEQLCRDREQLMKLAHDKYKSAKAGADEANQDLHRVIRDLSDEGLFNQPKKDGNVNVSGTMDEQAEEARERHMKAQSEQQEAEQIAEQEKLDIEQDELQRRDDEVADEVHA